MAHDQEVLFYREFLKSSPDQPEIPSTADCTQSLTGPASSRVTNASTELEIPPKTSSICPSIKFCSQENLDNVTAFLHTVRDHISAFQERQGIPRDENNFIGLTLIIIQQSGQAMYAVFMLFLALFPVVTIFCSIAHFVVDRAIDILTTKTPADIYLRLGILFVQLLLVYLMTQFVVFNIFSPIFTMQLNIISKMIMISRGSLVA